MPKPEGVTFVGCRVENSHLYLAHIQHPELLRTPTFLIEPIGPCDGLLVTAMRIGTDGENQLAVDSVPAAVFEMPPQVELILPPLLPGVDMVVQFENRDEAPALFTLWLGSISGIRQKANQLFSARELARFTPP